MVIISTEHTRSRKWKPLLKDNPTADILVWALLNHKSAREMSVAFMQDFSTVLDYHVRGCILKELLASILKETSFQKC